MTSPKWFDSKPSRVQALQLTDEASFEALKTWMNPRGDNVSTNLKWNEDDVWIWVAANNGWLQIENGEWVARDELGFYPIKDEIFQRKYEAEKARGCVCGWMPPIGAIGGETLLEHQTWCSTLRYGTKSDPEDNHPDAIYGRTYVAHAKRAEQKQAENIDQLRKETNRAWRLAMDAVINQRTDPDHLHKAQDAIETASRTQALYTMALQKSERT